jgi:nicotinate-nucleotide pyrophosphorylase (carboxylating)
MERLIMTAKLLDITQDPVVQNRINTALEEDIGSGDATTCSLVPADLIAEAEILARESCVISGTDVARYVFTALDAAMTVDTLLPDGQRAAAGQTVLRIKGPARTILTGERTALNFMQRMCGVATHTAAFVDKVKSTGTMILDTRKTTPGLRVFEKHAVLCGGGTNHRIGLFDKVLIKDNHRWLWKGSEGGDLGAAVREARRQYPDLEIEIEVESIPELQSALEGQPDWVLLDNMSPQTMADCVAVIAGRCRSEASGGITLATIEAVAASGVDAVSLGCLTHTVQSIDLSLEMLR